MQILPPKNRNFHNSKTFDNQMLKVGNTDFQLKDLANHNHLWKTSFYVKQNQLRSIINNFPCFIVKLVLSPRIGGSSNLFDAFQNSQFGSWNWKNSRPKWIFRKCEQIATCHGPQLYAVHIGVQSGANYLYRDVLSLMINYLVSNLKKVAFVHSFSIFSTNIIGTNNVYNLEKS